MSISILRLPDVKERTGLSRSQIYELIRRNEFPRQIELGVNSVGWIDNDIEGWIVAKINQSRERQQKKKVAIEQKAKSLGA